MLTTYKVQADEGLEAVWWKTGRILKKTGAAETGGRFSQVEVIDPRGSAPPMHIHHAEDETFYVLEGSVTAVVGDEEVELAAGDFAFCPRGVPHSYVITSDEARMLVTFSPSGFEEAFFALGVPVADHDQPDDSVFPPLDEVVRTLGAYGCEVVGPPPAL